MLIANGESEPSPVPMAACAECQSSARHSPITTRRVIELAVSQVFGVDVDRLRGATRDKAKIALARQVAMYLAHVTDGKSFTDVGTEFARDRTTVAHACGVEEDRRDDPVFDRALDLLEWAIPSLAVRGSSKLTSNSIF